MYDKNLQNSILGRYLHENELAYFYSHRFEKVLVILLI